MNADSAGKGLVVLLSGLWMPSLVMTPLALRLRRSGFASVRFGYASVRRNLSENAQRLADFLQGLDAERLHLVGHSLGGVLAMHTVSTHRPARVKNVVLIGSPYRDSYAGRHLASGPVGRGMVGNTVAEWLGAPRPGAPPGVAVGVIAGTVPYGLGMLVAPGQPRPTDGVVTVDETAVPGMTARICLPVSHSSMLVSANVARCVVRFLEVGAFPTPAAAGE